MRKRKGEKARMKKILIVLLLLLFLFALARIGTSTYENMLRSL